jgi:hypothetical protein
MSTTHTHFISTTNKILYLSDFVGVGVVNMEWQFVCDVILDKVI